MFNQLGNLGALLKQAKQIGSRVQGLAEELKARRATGSAGGGMVEIEVNGLGEVLACRIDPKLVDQQDRELLEDLVTAAANQAQAKARELHAEAVQGLTGELDVPGLQEALGRLTGEDK